MNAATSSPLPECNFFRNKSPLEAPPEEILLAYSCAVDQVHTFVSRVNDILKKKAKPNKATRIDVHRDLLKAGEFLSLVGTGMNKLRGFDGVRPSEFSEEDLKEAVEILLEGSREGLKPIKPSIFQQIMTFRFMQVMAKVGDENAIRFLESNKGCSAVVQQLSSMRSD